jgi:peptidoglycan hydrolase-like protein with peptidoglycan-binding domain
LASGPGVFGPRTERAVRAFQGDHQIRQTGVVGQYTQGALAAALSPSTARTLLEIPVQSLDAWVPT